MSDPKIFESVAHNVGWIAAIFGLGMGISGLLVALGVLKNKIATAASNAERFKRELYADDGVTNYMPRAELIPRLERIESSIGMLRTEILDGCHLNRNECRDAIAHQVNGLCEAIKRLDQKYHDQSLGIVAMSTQLSLLLKKAGVDTPTSVTDLERRLRSSAGECMRRYGDTAVYDLDKKNEGR